MFAGCKQAAMKRFVFAFPLVFSICFCHAQEVAVDSKGEPVFQLYSKEDVRLQLTRRAPVSGSYLFQAKQKSNNRFSGMLLQVMVLNSGDFPLIEKLKDIRPGGGIKIGYQQSVSPSGINDQPNGPARAWGINALFSVDNIKLYDTIKGAAEKKYPLTFGAETNYSFFFKNKTANSRWKKALAFYLALSGTWNDRNLLSYQEVSKITLRPDVIAMQDFDGRYGVLKKNFFKYRMAVSAPMFYKKLNPVPYFVAIFGTQNSPSYHMGVFTNLLSTSLENSESKFPSSFGFGFDWVYATERLPAKVNLFVKASVSLAH
jgi:hypothetical protein